jgi:hypothetical protein
MVQCAIPVRQVVSKTAAKSALVPDNKRSEVQPQVFFVPGSLDLYFQTDKEANWPPAPRAPYLQMEVEWPMGLAE